MIIRPVLTYDDLYEGMEIHVIDTYRGGKLCRGKIVRIHKVKNEKFLNGQFPPNSRYGGCGFTRHYDDIETYAELRTYSVDGEPLHAECHNGICVHVRYRNNVTAVNVKLYRIRPINPLNLLAEQGQ